METTASASIEVNSSEYYIDENGNYQYYTEESYYSNSLGGQEDEGEYDSSIYSSSNQQEEYNNEDGITTIKETPPKIQRHQTINEIQNYEDEQFYSNLSHRSKCILEIYTTEKAYLQHLNHVIGFYLDGIRNSNPPILDNSGIYEVFSNIEEIRNLSKEYIKDMKKQFEAGTEDVATPFLAKEKRFKELYIIYANNHASLVEGLSKLIEKKQNFQSFLQQVRDNPANTSRLDLPSFLIMPIQRMVRYGLLFDAATKNTSEEDQSTEFKIYQQAALMGSSITRAINEQIRRHQNLLKVLEIQSNLIGGPKIATENRIFVREGGLMKVCRKEDKFRWFFLFSDALMYCTSTNLQQQPQDNNGGGGGGSGGGVNNNLPQFQALPNSSNHSFTFHRLLLLSDINKIKDVKDKDTQKNAFQIVSSTEKSFTVYAETLKDKNNWLNDFKELLSNTGDKRGVVLVDGDHHSSLNSDEVPVWIPDKEAVKCMFCNDGFNIINRRHHCRSCGKVVCGSCSPHKRLIPHVKKNKPVRVCLFCYDYIAINEKESNNNTSNGSSNGNLSPQNPRNHIDRLNHILGDRKRTNSFSGFSSNSSDTTDNIHNHSSTGLDPASLNLSNIPNSSAGLSNKEHYSTFRKLKNKISKDSSSSSSTSSTSSTLISNSSNKEYTRSHSDLGLAVNNNNSTPTTVVTTNNGRPIKGAIPLPTTLSQGNLRSFLPPMLPVNNVVLKHNTTTTLPQTQTPPQQQLQSTPNLIKPNKTPTSPIHHQPPSHSLPTPPVPSHPSHPATPLPTINVQQPQPQILKKVIRTNSQQPIPPHQAPTSPVQQQTLQAPSTHPLGKSAPIIPPPRKLPPTINPRPNSFESSTHTTTVDHSNNNQTENNSTPTTINSSNNVISNKPPIQPRSNSNSNLIPTTPTHHITNQLQELDVKTPPPPTKLVGTSVLQKPAAPFRKRSASSSVEASTFIHHENNTAVEQPQIPIVKKRPLPQTPQSSSSNQS